MEFKKGSTYTRNDIHKLYFNEDVPAVGTGNWTTGYVRVDDELIVFMNIDIPGTTGHDFPNQYDTSNNTIKWYGKPGSNSQQPTFQKLFNNELTPHFFARWDSKDPFTYLGVGKIIDFKDGHPTKKSDGSETTTIEIILTCDESDYILPSLLEQKEEVRNFSTGKFALEKYLEEFIIDNWNSIEGIGDKYQICEEQVDGKRKKFRTDTGEVDIFALSKDKTEYLIIELKKGRASDSVVGQIQRYMGYVKDEVANSDQKVKGLIIALDDDLRIRRALSVTNDIEFNSYKIDFKLYKSE